MLPDDFFPVGTLVSLRPSSQYWPRQGTQFGVPKIGIVTESLDYYKKNVPMKGKKASVITVRWLGTENDLYADIHRNGESVLMEPDKANRDGWLYSRSDLFRHKLGTIENSAEFYESILHESLDELRGEL